MTTRYIVKVRHYDEQAQILDPRFTRKWKAELYMRQQAEILKGYNLSYGWIDDTFRVFNPDGTCKTMLWVSRETN